MGDKKEWKTREPRRILDGFARKRRQKKALEALEQDNFHDDPHANLVMHKKAPKFEESLEGKRNKKKLKAEPFKQRFKKNFAVLLEEEQANTSDEPGYVEATAKPSNFPNRKFCAVCGCPSNYTCVPCGAWYCSVKCLGTHQDTRCLKWTA